MHMLKESNRHEGLVFVDLRIYSYKAFLHTTRGTNGTRRRTSIENGRYDVLITTRVTEQIMENLRPRSVALGSADGGSKHIPAL